ncbi:hypothetical protein B0H17DRAFT_1130277 [Mycena rosella]|uniref:Uncharacterized protein n=1 Tax=Mycena rosella TaxID=1033263 RepID=A0AAD7DS03_MYCRO|nr:hypothetical protein B0H17DRAFT_1130277 [Mycena rosella]
MLRSPTVLEVALGLLAFFLLRLFLYSRRPFTSGPAPLARHKGWPRRTYGKWAEQWGDTTSVTVFGQHIVILNSLKAATEMLDKKSSVYSDRPVFQMYGELAGKTRWASYHTGSRSSDTIANIFTQLFGNHANYWSKFYPVTVGEYKNAVVLRITYGYTVRSGNDPIVALADSVMEEFSAASVPIAFLGVYMPSAHSSSIDSQVYPLLDSGRGLPEQGQDLGEAFV